MKDLTICALCGEEYSAEDVADLKDMGEAFSRNPFICPDCYDRLQRMDPEDQIIELLRLGSENRKPR